MHRRAIATEPEVLLMDEPCSALDPIATRKIEELMLELKQRYTIAIRYPQPAAGGPRRRPNGVLVRRHIAGGRTGHLVEFGPTKAPLSEPRERSTQQYVSGEFS